MKRTVVFIFIAFCAASVLSLAEDEKKSKPSVTVSPAEEFSSTQTSTSNSTTPTSAKPTTTTAKPTTTPVKPTTTTAKPTTTTAKPTTTTVKPTTTTAKPTTTTAKPTTTTAKPTTTTTAKPTTTTAKPTTTTAKPTTPPPPTPTPPTNLTVGNYNVTTDKKVICLMAQMALQIRLATPKTNGTFVVQPQFTKAEGGCQETEANLTLVFKEGFITFMFNKSGENVLVDALSFVLSYTFSKGGNEKYTAKNNSVHLFTAKVGHSYSCKAESVYMGNGLYLDVNQDRMQAFNLTKSNEFGSPDPCPADKPDYRIAIAVGVTLLVLIVIVVVVYLLGRRKRADGYQSL